MGFFNCQHSFLQTRLRETPMNNTTRVNNIHECEMSMVEETTQSLERLDDKVVAELCRDYAHYTRVNISGEHGQVVTQIAAIEEQLSTFSEMLTDIQANNVILKDILPKIATQFESLKPSFTKIDRMEELIVRINEDFDVIEKQLQEAENTIVEGTLKNVLKMPLNLFNKQLSVAEAATSPIAGASGNKPSFNPHPIFKTEDYF